MLTHKEMTAHIRKRIKARVRLYTTCGTRYIQVFTPTYESHFEADEIEKICVIAQVNKLTGAYCSPIDPKHERLLAGKQTWDFEFHHQGRQP